MAFDHSSRQVRRHYRDALPRTTVRGFRGRGYRVQSTFRQRLPADVKAVVVSGITGRFAEFPRPVLNSLPQIDNSMGYAVLSDPVAIQELGCRIIVAVLAHRPNRLFKWH